MKSFKRIAAVMMAAMLLMSVGSFALAAPAWDGGSANIVVKPTSTVYYAFDGIAQVQLTISNESATEAVSFEFTSLSFNESVAVSPSTAASELQGLIDYGKLTLPTAGSTGSSMNIVLNVQIQDIEKISGSTKIALGMRVYNADLTTSDVIEYVTDGTNVTTPAAVPITAYSANTGTDGGSAGPSFRINPVDAKGIRVPAPAGNYGQQVTVRIPLLVLKSSYAVSISPVLTTSLDTFPFVISNVDYTLSYPSDVTTGQIIEFDYTFTLSKNVTAGVKQVDFAVTSYESPWSGGNAVKTDKISIFVNVVKGAAASGGTNTPGAVSTPKLIVQSYSFSTEKVYAGEPFDVTFVLKNTSDSETIQNLQIHIADAGNVILPANSASNTLYVAKIGKGETYSQTLTMQSAPGAEAKAYTLGIDMDYEAASTKTAYKASETITVPVLQKIRVKADEPVVYDEAWVGSPVSLYMAFYNLGKSSVYNCAISIEGDGLSMAEGYFGGNVSSGASMSADFSIIPSVAGDISANVVVTYEDVYGEEYQLKVPFNLFVNEGGGEIIDGGMEPMPMPDGGMNVDGEPVSGQGLPVWVWIAIGTAVAAGVVVLLLLLKRRRSKESEEL